MAIRLIVRTQDGGFAVNIGGPGTPFETSFRTFDIEAPELEKYLMEPVTGNWTATTREIIGAEVVAETN